MTAGRSALLLGCAGVRRESPCRESLKCPHTPDPTTSPPPHRVSALKAAGAVLAVAVGSAGARGWPPARPRRRGDRAARRGDRDRRATCRPGWPIQTGATSRITLNTATGQLGAAQTLAPAADCGVNLGAAARQLLTLRGSTGGSPSAPAGLVPERVDRGEGEEERHVVLPGRAPTVRVRSSSASARGCARPRGRRRRHAPPTSTSSSRAAPASSRPSRSAECVVGTYELQSGSSIGKPPRRRPHRRSPATTRPTPGRTVGDQRQLPLADQCSVVARGRRRRLLRHPHAQGRRGVLLPRGWG